MTSLLNGPGLPGYSSTGKDALDSDGPLDPTEEEDHNGRTEGVESYSLTPSPLGDEPTSWKQRIRACATKFPLSVFFIVGNEFCERFSYYGLRAVLTLYLVRFLSYEEDTATALYHTFIVLCYLSPILGAIIADSCLGKFATIIALSIVYAVGNIFVSLSAIPTIYSVEAQRLIGERSLAFTGLALISLGTGGIKPCVSAFGGDQFKEEQKHLIPKFFAIFYFSINAGSLLSTFLTPIFRADVQCFGGDCYALAFGVPAILMFVSLVVFVLGSPFYTISRPKCGRFYDIIIFKFAITVFLTIYQCVVLLVRKVLSCLKREKTWTPHSSVFSLAERKYGAGFVADVKDVLKVLVMFLPLPGFWALFDQQGSRWTLQATRMNGEITPTFQIQPDQVQSLNPVLILVFIPLFELLVYPLLAKCKLLKRPLQRMVTGMTLAGLSFVVAALVQIYITRSLDVIPPGLGRLSFINPTNTSVLLGRVDNTTLNRTLSYAQTYQHPFLPAGGHTVCLWTGQEGGACEEYRVQLASGEVILFVVATNGTEPTQVRGTVIEDIGSNITIRIVNMLDVVVNVSLLAEDTSSGSRDLQHFAFGTLNPGNFTGYHSLKTLDYRYTISFEGGGQPQLGDLQAEVGHKLHSGGGYTLVLIPNLVGNQTLAHIILDEDVAPNGVSVALQIPMYVLITAGEIMFSITGLDFAYSQAPVSMKSILQAAWHLTVAGGNFIVIIITEARLFESQTAEFFFFAALIFALAVAFGIMACIYTYKDDRKRGRGGSFNQEEVESTESAHSPPETESSGEKDPLLEETGPGQGDSTQPRTAISSL